MPAVTTKTSKVESVLKASVDSMKVMLGVLFPPTDADYSLNTESYALNLDDTYDLPSHGTIAMEVYISEPEGHGHSSDSAELCGRRRRFIFVCE